ncbi:Sec14 cytosolic factor [Colletotrichum shisoi]|uniref:Sec14 cytosolic factor n=1 Tax=Colletotrichum shisoi TaxID=2078593 RepID=A0A5Q4BQ07_9PEZI|nr:Sec14 cytosolic factor [Colletotrichum shisoi]
MTTEDQHPQGSPKWETAPELDPKYDDYYLGDFPTVARIGEPRDGERGYAGHLNDMQKAQLFQLRSLLEAEGHTERLDTLTMLRFLRARKFDVNLTKQMFIDFESWRKKSLLDALDGRPLYIEHLGGINLTAMRSITTDERMLDNLAVEYEKCADPRFPACSRQAGKLVETCCTIMDTRGVSLVKASQVYDYINKASVVLQKYYPERLGKLYIINALWGFSTVWSFVKGWLDPVTVNKIHILGGGYQKELLARIPADNLPVEFGGRCVCAEGCQNSDAGPWGDPQWKQDAWWEKKDAIEKANVALKGTAKDPALRNKSR